MKLIDALLFHIRHNPVILYRGEGELEFIKKFISGIPECEENRSGEDSASTVKDLIGQCRKCGNSVEKKYPFGSGENRVMIILNAPRLLTKEEKDKYRNESINLLKRIIEAIRLKYADCYITNLIKCDADDPLIMPSTMLNECKNFLIREIEFIKPEIVIVMGEMLPMQKIINDFRNIAWYNIHHPVTMLKNPDLKKPAWNTLKLVMNRIKEISPD